MNRLFHPLQDPSREIFHNQLLAISADHVFVRENERAGIAREFHDDIGQSLVAMKWDVSLLKKKVLNADQKTSCASLASEIIQIESQINHALEGLRTLIAGLRPETVTNLGLKGAIEWHAREFQSHTGIPVQVRAEPETITMKDPNHTMALFRIFQEVLTNVCKHAVASRVEATIRADREFFLMQIEDDGKGISNSDLQRTASFGLLGLKERVLLLQGDVEIQGAPDKGTTITVRVPLHLCKNANDDGPREKQKEIKLFLWKED
jgi:signal transduction histidine kinase